MTPRTLPPSPSTRPVVHEGPTLASALILCLVAAQENLIDTEAWLWSRS